MGPKETEKMHLKKLRVKTFSTGGMKEGFKEEMVPDMNLEETLKKEGNSK